MPPMTDLHREHLLVGPAGKPVERPAEIEVAAGHNSGSVGFAIGLPEDVPGIVAHAGWMAGADGDPNRSS